MILSDRLKTIVNYVPKNTIIADIGTDHGYIPLYLIENKISKKAIATDISKGSISKAEENIINSEYKDFISIRLGNGLETIKPFEADTLIISGMGGVLIRDILDKDKLIRDSFVYYIFQPNNGSEELRKYLLSNNFKIIDESLVYDNNKYYEIIFATHGKQNWYHTEFYEIGERLIYKKDPLLKEFINFKLNEDTSVLSTIEHIDSEKVTDRKAFLRKRIDYYKEVLDKLEGKKDS